MVLRILLLELDWSIIKENILQIHSSLLRIYKKYEIDTVTGHSLGGRDAIFLGLRYNIKNVVAYNPAPLEVKAFVINLVVNCLEIRHFQMKNI